jgi:hypothetical protein
MTVFAAASLVEGIGADSDVVVCVVHDRSLSWDRNQIACVFSS